MASFAAKYIAKKVLGETSKNHYGKDDPYFERVPAGELGDNHSKKIKRQPKAFPPGISEHDKKILTKARRRAYILDLGFNVCGIQFGMGSLIGIVPAIGDFLDLFMALMVVRTCQNVDDGLPPAVKSKMVMNVVVDFFIGLVPFLGDLADAVFRANTRNVILLERHLAEKGERTLGRPHRSRAEPDRRSRNHDSSPAYEARHDVRQAEPTAPEPVRAQESSASSRGWFNFRSQRPGPRDVEAGQAPMYR